MNADGTLPNTTLACVCAPTADVCADYQCSHSIAISGDASPMTSGCSTLSIVRLRGLRQAGRGCAAGFQRGKTATAMMGYR